jgi:hypothetical protein
MTRKIIFSQIIFLLALLVFAGCKKNTEKFLGNETVLASKNFSVVGNTFEIWRTIKGASYNGLISTATPYVGFNFQKSCQYYKAKLSERVSWKIEITCYRTGAQKVVMGVSDSINYSNSLWDGGATTDRFFYTGDTIEVKLSFAGSDLVLRDTLVVSAAKSYTTNAIINPAGSDGIIYYLVDDFEGDITAAPEPFSPFYIDQGDLGGNNFGNNGYGGNKIQGNFSYKMYGTDTNNNTYLGSCNTPTLNDFPAGTFTTKNPDSLYINMYIYGFNKANTTVTLLVYENDENQPAGAYDKTKNDTWIYQQSVNWAGWKLVSIPYRAFYRPKPATSITGLGNNMLNPDRLCGMVLELDSYPTQGYEVEALVDMVVITENGIFNK